MKKLVGLLLVILAFAVPVYAQDQITYVSQPDDVTVFLNNIAFVRDTLTVVGSAEVQITLPAQAYVETLIVREAQGRTSAYSISRANAANQPVLKLPSQNTTETRQITLEYLTGGLSWQPNYTMSITTGKDDAVQYDFFAAIQNDLFTLKDIEVKLAAARVDVSQQAGAGQSPTANQYIAGYDQTGTNPALSAGTVTVQYVYSVGKISAQPGDTIYVKLLEQPLPSRRLLLWNASTDQQATVIYKVRNESTLPLTEGIVHSYQDGLFVGSDFVEFTPVGSEGSITVGSLQDVRVHRDESITALPSSTDLRAQHDVTLTMSNYSDRAVDLDVVDTWNPDGQEFTFSQEPAREAGNLFRWTVSIPAGGTLTITYQFKAKY